MKALLNFLMSWLLLATTGSVSAAVRYVDTNSTDPTPPYTNWASAAVTIQQAVDAAVAGDEIVVTNGLYATGERAVGTNLLANRVAVDKPLALRSVNGPQFTVIQGYQVPGTTNAAGAIRCVYLTDGASLSGFTLANGATRIWNPGIAEREVGGGGVWCGSTNATVTNCVMVGNSASHLGGGACGGTLYHCALTGNSAQSGGGAADGTLYHCTLSGNSAQSWGGGAYDCMLQDSALTGNSSDHFGGGACTSTLVNCVLTANSARDGEGGGALACTLRNCVLADNSATQGGGAFGGTLDNCTLTGNSAGAGGGVAAGLWAYADIIECRLQNCIVYANQAAADANYTTNLTTFTYSCTSPLPADGAGNIDRDPLFVDAAANNYRLRSDSPCINAGSSDYAPGLTDLDGRHRIVSGAVDMGAYEFQAPAPGSWNRKANMPKALDAQASCEVDGILYVIGGHEIPGVYRELATLYAYDPKTDSWTQKADMPTARRWPAACVVDGIIYVMGGGCMFSPATNVVEAYDPKTDTWTTKAKLPSARSAVAACAMDGIIYAIGGVIGTISAGPMQPLATVEAYDPQADQWTPRTSLPTASAFHSAQAVNGIIYVFFKKETFAYDAKTDRWTRKAPIPAWSLNSFFTATSTVDGIVYLFGGSSSSGDTTYDLTLAYDPKLDSYSARRRIPMPCEAAACAIIDGKIYHTGGADQDPIVYGDCVYYDSLWVFDPQGGVTPKLSSLTRESADSVRLVWQGEAGRLYGVQSTVNLANSRSWAPVTLSTGPTILATNEVVEATCTVLPADTKRFFRILEAN